MFLSNWLVFKIVLAAVTGLVDYPLAADVLLVYDNANKLYLSGGSLEYVSNVVLYKGETSYTLGMGDIINKTTTTAYEVVLPSSSVHGTVGINQDATRYVHQYPEASGYLNGKFQVYSGTPSDGYTEYGSEIQPFSGDEAILCSMSADGKYVLVGNWMNTGGYSDGYKMYKDNGSEYVYHSTYTSIGSSTSQRGYQPAFVPSNNNFVITGTNNSSVWLFKLYVYDSATESWTAKDTVTPSGSSTADVQRGITGKGFTYDGSYFFQNNNGATTRGEVWSVDWDANTMTYKWHTTEGSDGDGAGGAISPDNRYVVLARHDGNPYRVYENMSGDWSTVENVTSQFDLTGSGTGTIFGGYGIEFSGYSSENTTPLYIGQVSFHGDGKFRLENWAKRSLYEIYITQPGTYRADLQICGIDYKTNEVEVTGTPSDIELYTEPETDFTANKAVLSSTSSVSYHQGGMSDNGEYYFYGQQVYKKDTGSFTYTTYGSALSSTIFNGSQSSISHDGNYIVSYYTNSTYQLHIIKNNGSTFTSHQIIASPNSSARSDSQPQFIPGPLKHFVWIEKVSGSSNITFHFYKYNSGTDTWSLGFSVTNPTDLTVGDSLYGRGGISFSKDGNYLAISASTADTSNKGVAVLKVDWVNETCVKKYENTSVGYWACFLSSDAKYFYYSTSTGTTAGKMLYSANGDWEGTPTDVTSSFTNIGNLGDHTSVFSGRYIFSEKGGSARYIFKWNDLISPTLTFDNYNKLSLTNTPTYTSSKLTYGSNVYDIGTLTSDITIEKQGEYASLTFDTSSNVAYFSNVTVGAIASTMAGYEVEQILYGTHNSDSPSQGGFGHYIDTNGDGTRFVLGVGMDPTTGQYDGRVKVYHLESGTWTLKVDLASPNTASQRFGDSVCMNEDGTRIVVNHYPSDVQTSRAYIYDYASGAWPTTPTATLIGTAPFGEGDMDMNRAGTVIVFGSRASGTQIWSRAGDGTWSETKNWGNGSGGYGVAINGAGTRIVTGKESTGEIFEGNYVGGSWGSLTSVIDTSYTSWPAKIRMDSDGTTLIVNADPATEAGIYERQSGTSWTLSQSILSMASYYSRNGLSISYDGNMVLVGDMTNDTDGNNFGRAFLWNKSGGSWSLTKTFSNPKTSPAVNDYWGAGVAIAKNTKDRLIIGMSADSTAGTEYGSVYVHTNAIPDFITFDTYNKLSLSGITNPTSKLHALPTGAESTTTYDIGTATNIYIESAGTYTAEMKGSSAFALDSNVATYSNPPRFGDSTTYSYTGSDQTISVPSGATHVKVVLKGAGGGHGYDSYSDAIGGTGGYTEAEIELPSGTTSLTLIVGQGGDSDVNTSKTYGGGGGSGDDGGATGGRGGGRTAIRIGSTEIATAGGGGGGSYNNSDSSKNPGFNGGGLIALGGTDPQGGGGTQTTGGSAGHGSSTTGGAGAQYEGGTGSITGTGWGGAGGGGGWYGGGGGGGLSGHHGAGGGGSGFAGRDGSTVLSGNERGSTSAYADTTQRSDSVNNCKYKNVKVLRAGGSAGQVGASGTINHGVAEISFENLIPKLTFDTYNKLTFTNADTGSTYKLKYESNTYDLGTISNVYIAHPGTYSAEIKGATNFALSSNVTGGTITPYKVWKANEDQILYSSDIAAADAFGERIAIDGNYAVVGARQADPNGTLSGAAYVFYKSGTTWSQQQKLVASDSSANYEFGYCVDISGDTIVVGSGPYDGSPGSNSGKVYVFKRSGTTWTQQASFQSSDIQTEDYFGWSVSIHGDYIIAGARTEDTDGSNTGSAYIFKRVHQENPEFTANSTLHTDYTSKYGWSSDSGWEVSSKNELNSSSYPTWKAFNKSDASNNNWLSGSAPSTSSPQWLKIKYPSQQVIKSYVIRARSNSSPRYPTAWKLQGANTDIGDTDSGWTDIGTEQTQTIWEQNQSKPFDVSTNTTAYQYYRLRITGTKESATSSNSDYVAIGQWKLFTGTDKTYWTQESKIQAGDRQTSDNFGSSVSIHGDYAIVAAYLEDEGGSNAGAAYLYKRDGTTWSQQYKLMASDKQAEDYYGGDTQGVGIYGDYAVVGARLEDSNGSNAGAAYVYKKTTNSISTFVPPDQFINTGSGVAWGPYPFDYQSTSGTKHYYAPNTIGTQYDMYYDTSDSKFYDGNGSNEPHTFSVNGGTAGSSAGPAVNGDYVQIFGNGGGLLNSFVMSGWGGESWSQEAKLQASDVQLNSQFGVCVSISGDRLVVGASSDDRTATDAGAVYIFERSGTTWTEVKKITASDAQASDSFGISVAIDGTTVFVGAYGEDTKGGGAGAAYVYEKVNVLDFDGYNKLTFTGLESGSTSTLKYGSNTYDIGTASNVYISEQGTYEAESKGTTTFALTSNVVGTMNTPFTAAFHYGAFSSSDYSGAYSTVGAAATAGFVYSDTTPATYTWGTLNSVDTSTTGQTGYSWTPTSDITADVLMVAGGGGGGGANGGGGGAGGLVYNSGISLSGAKTIVVGTGGAKGINWNTNGTNATKGNNTSFADLETAIGGGAGSTYLNNPDIGSNDNGGSGGGGGGSSNTSSYINGGSGTSGQGNGGGRGIRYAGGGGGGAGGSGSDGSSPQTGGAGGTGLNYTTTFGTTYGDSGWFAGGGGGGQGGGQGGQGGGGDGGTPNTEPGYNGQSHTGGGGGGGNGAGGGAGGSGIVIIRSGPSVTPPSLTFDGYKLVVKNITPTSTTLKYGSNTYEIGTATNIYVKDTGAYTAEIGSAADFALTNTTVSGTIKTIEPGFASRYQGSMALTYDGKLYAWGMNDDGEAGVGTSSDITVPTLCTGITQGTVAKLLSSSDLTDNSRGEVSYVKTIDGKIYATGKGDNFVIPGTTSDLTSFTDVTSYFGDQSLTANNVTMMSFTDRSGAALTETGNVWTWGTHDTTYKALGQAGASSSSTPKQINFSSATDNITKVTCGHYHTLALDSSGDVWFWGKNGINSDSWPSSVTDEPQKVVDGKNIIGLASSYGTMYAWDATGKMWNAGNNYEGQIGDGTTTANSSGKTLTEVTYFSSKGITINKVYAGGYFVFADTSDGYYCWGNGGHGVFGNGSTGNITSPAKWTNVSNIKKFMASTQHTTAITEDGKYYAWGRDYHGSRGDSDSSSDITYPKHIDTLPNILAPSFEFDGYDKVFVNKPYEIQIWCVLAQVKSASTLDGLEFTGITPSKIYIPYQNNSYTIASSGMNVIWRGNGTEDGYPLNVNEHIATIYVNENISNFTNLRIKYITSADAQNRLLGLKFIINGVTILEETTKQTIDSNYKTSYSFTPSIFYSITKYTKGTTTYDVGSSQIVTVSDPGTYDAQLSQGGVFSLKSATVPATSSSGLYTWAFHHGNFDNAYGDGDILTARDNGRFYADTPAYTGDIGTITAVNPFGTTQPTLVSSLTITNGKALNTLSYSSYVYRSTDTTNTRYVYALGTLSENTKYDIAYNWVTKKWLDIDSDATHNTFGTSASDTTNTSRISTENPQTVYVMETYWNLLFAIFTNPYYQESVSSTTYTFTPASTLTANVLMVAGGGGGGGRYNCGGGGAGGLVYTADTSLTNGVTKTIVVGNGDSGGNGGGQSGLSGKDTTFTDLDTAFGGGGGHNQGSDGISGGSGGGGGGGEESNYSQGGTGGSGTANQGNDGGGGLNATTHGGGGGGGAGSAGTTATGSGTSGNGGTGKFFGEGSSYTNFGDEYGEGGYFAGGGGGGKRSGSSYGIPGRGGGGYGQPSSGYMGVGGSQHGMIHTGGGGGGGGNANTDQIPGYDGEGQGGVRGHGGRGGSGIVLIQTNVALPNGANTAVVQVGNPRRRSLQPTVDAMGSEVNRFSIIDSASMPEYRLPTHWYTDPISSNSDRKNNDGSSYGKYTIQTRADGGTSNVWYATAHDPIYLHCSMMQTMDAVFMPVEKDVRYDMLLAGEADDGGGIQLDMGSDGTAKLYRGYNSTLIASSTEVCFTVGKWHHIALTIDSGGNAVGYVNGYPVVTGTHTSSTAVGSRNASTFFRCGDPSYGVTFRKHLTYEVSTYNFHMSPKQVLQRAAEVGLGPKLEYDGLNAINIVNTEPGSGTEITIYESNVNDTSNLYVVACNSSSYLLSNAGTYYAQIKGTDTFTITRPLTVTDDHFPLYQYPPTDGTTSSLTTGTAANSFNNFWTISGAANGNGQYQVKCNTAAENNHYNAWRNNVGSTNYWQTPADPTYPITFTILLPSAKTIRKYRMFPLDHVNPYGPGTDATSGTSVDPTLQGNGGGDATKRPKSWILKGSNDDADWTDLDTVTNKPISIYGDVYSIDSPASYLYYQLSVTANNGGDKLLFGDIQLWGDA